MSCELARMNYLSELNEWVQLVELLRDTPLPRVVGAEDWTNFEKLTDSCRQAFERYLSAQREYAAAAAQHQHPQDEPADPPRGPTRSTPRPSARPKRTRWTS